ncbi:hypothetical protein PYK79_46475 [Streptomyces sp. ID05-04B]|uniref:hypothetical protein n=1 Tax=Streptomyces sp. ID05-04B TaxID=3028661 RepID=UPI0029C155E5|nr:hypothetical protein [Streptomyces sp. ID05-04B]MDX5569253.1 hypothetical protein [Streptomyces sp. ID05-04B]
MAADDGLGDIDPAIEAGTPEYWRARARQWENRCHRAEREKTELIAELNQLRERQPSQREARRNAITNGDVYPGTGSPPRPR